MFVPTILGVDLAAHSIATSIFECFGIKSHAFGRYRCGISYYSSIMKTHTDERLLDENVAKERLISFAKEQKKTCLLIPSTDWYVDLALRLHDELSPYYKFVLVDKELFSKLSEKEQFYQTLDGFGIPHPQTHAFDLSSQILWDTFPCVLKPSSSIEAQKRAFPGQKKVYIIGNRGELEQTLSLLRQYHSGMRYLLQPYLVAQKSYVLSVFCQKNFGTRVASLAEVAMEELGDTSRGNYCALLVRELSECARSLIAFCDNIGYEGVANFDIIRSGGKDYVLEMNLRSGRSCDYLRAAGHSIGDFLFKSQNRINPYPKCMTSVPAYWRCINDREVLRHANPSLREEIEEKIRSGFAFSPYENVTHMPHPIEWVYRTIHRHRATRAASLAYTR